MVAGTAFIAPAFLLMIALSWAYFRWNDIAGVADLFDGVAPAVIAVLTVTLWRLFRSSVKDVPQLAIMAAAGAFAYWFTVWEPLILLAAGTAGVVLYLAPGRSYPGIPLLSVAPWPLWAAPLLVAAFFSWQPSALVDLTTLFLRAGGLLFGGGYVLIPLIQGDVVDRYRWLTSDQFVDGVALGQMTPGPIVLTATFVGYGAAGLPGAIVATVAVFAPSFVFAIVVGRFLDRVRSWKMANAFLRGVGPAVVGSIAAVSAKLGEDAIVNGWTAAVFVVALVLAWRYGPIPAILIGGAAGIAAGAVT
jgi:chromate transporter